MKDWQTLIKKIKSDIENNLTERRLYHTINVMNESLKLAEPFNIDKERIIVPALLHDRFRDTSDEILNNYIDKYGVGENYKNNNPLAHGPIAAKYAEDKYGINDIDILNAIKYHTTARHNMSLLEKIIFLADSTEKSRNYNGISNIRKNAKRSIDDGIRECLISTIDYLKKNGKPIDKNSEEALEYIESHLV